MTRRMPEDPIVGGLVNLIRAQQFNRRQLFRGAAVAGAGAGTMALAACSTGGGGGENGSIVWGNWPYYLDTDDAGTYPSLDQFIAESGIMVEYIEDIDDNNTFYGKIKDQLALDQFTGYDDRGRRFAAAVHELVGGAADAEPENPGDPAPPAG